MSRVTVIGAGSWGTALSLVLADNGHEVRLWARRIEQVAEINERHTNEQYLPGVVLPTSIIGYTNIGEAIHESEVILLAVPTKAIRETAAQIASLLTKKVLVIHASKGIEPRTSKRISEMIAEELPETLRESIAVLSGPSHAEEVCLRLPTTVTVSATDECAMKKSQDLFMNQNFRVYTNPDLIGVEIGGALKNIIALGVGLISGRKLGDNAKAAFMTRGLAEMARLGIKMGANPLTFSGLSGLGDLIVTCTSVHSRNFRAGELLGRGYSLDEVLAQMGMVVEGVKTTEATYELAEKVAVDMPIVKQLYAVLFENKRIEAALAELMDRDKKAENVDLISFWEQRKHER